MKSQTVFLTLFLIALAAFLKIGIAQPAYSDSHLPTVVITHNDDEEGTECGDADGDGQCDSDTDKE